MKTLRWSLGILLLIPVGYAPAQAQQAPPAPAAASPADAAAAAKTDSDLKPKKARVWDNDNIPKAGDEISVVGQPIPDQSSSTAAPAGDANSGGTPAPGSDKDRDKDKKDEGARSSSDKDSRLAAAKEKLDSLKKDLDLAQRRLTLDSQMYYSKPDYQTDPEGAEQLKTEKDAVAAKQDEVDAAQKELDALEAELGGSASQ
jgi:hypothetical protein